jgi:hypothetical protein
MSATLTSQSRWKELAFGSDTHFTRQNMRALFGLLALLGVAGIVFGIIIMIQGAQSEPFSFENYGGPGPIIGGLLLTAVSLYLFLNWPRLTSSREVHRQ